MKGIEIMLEVSAAQWLSTKFRDRRRATRGVGMVSLGGSRVLDKEIVKPHPMPKSCKTACISPQEPKQMQLHSSGYTMSKAGLHSFATLQVESGIMTNVILLPFLVGTGPITTSCVHIYLVRKM